MKLEQQPPTYPIASVDNALQLLLLFRQEKHIRIADASSRLGVARSTAHRLMEMLVYRGFVTRDERTRAYGPGTALLDIGLSAVGHLDVRSVARPFLVELRDATRETVHLATLELPDVRFIECVEGDRTIRAASRVGQSLPAHCTSAGKVLLAAAPRSTVKNYLHNRRLRPLTPRSVTRHADLLVQLDAIRAKGYAVNLEESEEGLGSVAVAIVDSLASPRAALSVAAPVHRCTNRDFERFAAVVGATAGRIGAALP
jgi:IclR family acetate operon transcriptional repressor